MRYKKGFSQKLHLKIHFLTHTQEKLFTCEVCNKRFSQKPNLRTHLFIHAKEKSFISAACNTGISQISTTMHVPIFILNGRLLICEMREKRVSSKGLPKFPSSYLFQKLDIS